MLDWLSAWYKKRTAKTKRVIVLVVGLSGVSIFYLLGRFVLPLQGPDEGLFTEIVGILVTVFVIDGLRSIGTDTEVKKSLLRRAASTSNETAKAAIDELRKTGLINRGVLRGADLSGACLCGAMLENVDLSGVNLENADLSDAYLDGAILVDAKLCRTKFHRTTMVKVQLAGSDLSRTEFEKADLTNAVFKRNCLDKDGPRNLPSAKFIESKLIGVDFSHLKTMQGSTFSKCDMRRTVFENCTLERSNFTESDLRKAILTEANLQYCDFALCALDDVELQNADLQYTTLTEANLSRANLKQAALDYTTYGGSIFSEAILFGASFVKSKLGVDTEGKSYAEADFVDAEFDIRTVLPDGNHWNSSVDEDMFGKFGMRRIRDVSSYMDEYPDNESDPSNRQE